MSCAEVMRSGTARGTGCCLGLGAEEGQSGPDPLLSLQAGEEGMNFSVVVIGHAAPTGHTLRLLNFPTIVGGAWRLMQIKNQIQPLHLTGRQGPWAAKESPESEQGSQSHTVTKAFTTCPLSQRFPVGGLGSSLVRPPHLGVPASTSCVPQTELETTYSKSITYE